MDVKEACAYPGGAQNQVAKAPKNRHLVRMTKSLLTILLVIFFDLLGFSFIIPFLPTYVATLGGDPFWFGIILASYSLGQFFMAPVWGRLSDRVGRRPILLISTAGSVLAWSSLALVPNLIFLLVVRFIAGLMSANFTVAQSYIVDVSPLEKRTANLGLTGMAFGLGFILGPPSGGFLFTLGRSVPFWGASLLALTAFLLVVFVVPESLKPLKLRSPEEKPSPPRLRRFSRKILVQTLQDPAVGGILLVNLGFSMAFSLFQSMFSQVTTLALHFSPLWIGLSLAYVGLLVALVQGGGLKALLRFFPERPLMWAGLLVCGAGLLAWAFTFNAVYLAVVLIFISLGGGVGTVLIRSLLTKAVPDAEVGGVLGLSSSIDSLTRVLGPLLGGVLVTAGAFWPGLAAGGAAILVALWGAFSLGWKGEKGTLKAVK
jgi:DHA1 family tetracycline resistance protein-like MFS transporter